MEAAYAKMFRGNWGNYLKFLTFLSKIYIRKTKGKIQIIVANCMLMGIGVWKHMILSMKILG